MRRLMAVSAMVALLCLHPASRMQADETQPGVAERLLRFAPAGTWGVVSVDAAALLGSPALKDVHLRPPPQSDIPDYDDIKAAALYLLPAPLPLKAPPPWCAVLVLKPDARPGIEKRLAEDPQRQDVEGLSAYVTSRSALAFGDDTTLLAAPDTRSLAPLVRSWRAGGEAGADKSLLEILAPVRKNVAFAAFVRPNERAATKGADRSAQGDSLESTNAVRVSVSLGEKVTLTATARFGSPEEAQRADAALNEQLEATRQQVRAALSQTNEAPSPFVETALWACDNIQVSSKGPDLHMVLPLRQQDISWLARFGAAAMARSASRPPRRTQAPAPSSEAPGADESHPVH